MATNFPTTIDSLTNPTATDKVSVVSHADQHANSNDAIEALETKVGVDGSAVTTTHDYKLSNVTGSDKAVSLTGAETLTNKTLTTPVISTISNTGTVTLPTSTDTLVGRATTDTLTNKTLTSPVLDGTLSGTAFLDEDLMTSDSATAVASQQSIKAYVDAASTAVVKSLLYSRINANINNTTALYVCPNVTSDNNSEWSSSTNTAQHRFYFPFDAEISKIDVNVSASALTGGNTRTYTLNKNGTDTALATTLTDSELSGSGTGTISITSGDYIILKLTTTTASTHSNPQITLTYSPV